MKKSFTHFLVILFFLFLGTGTVWAQPTSGKIYRFDNSANSGYSMASTGLTRSSIKPTSDTDYSQMWLVETHPSNSNAWTLRNLGNGKYLQHAGTSAFWGFVDENTSATALYYITTDSYCTFNNTNSSGGYTCMHYSSSQGGIVGWSSTASASKWTMTEITTVTADDLAANWAELEVFYNSSNATMVEGYEANLANLFSDKACTTPAKSLTTEAAIEADADYQALPAGLQEVVKKVYLDDWAEDNFDTTKDGWSSEYGKRFRVQMIEPHSIAGDITSYFGINAHNNMDNPLGIFANTRDIIYIMVEGEIKAGAELWLCHINGHGQLQPHANYASNGYIQLDEGLNAVPYFSDGNALWLNYIVDTYNPDAAGTARFQNPLSNFDDLKVHIVGGNINGFYNAVGDDLWGEPDNDADWDYYRTRATLTDFTVLGNRVTLQFYFNSIVVDGKTCSGMYDLLENVTVPTKPYCYSGTKGTPATWNQYTNMGLDATASPINIMVEAWDRIAMSQHATHGFLSTSQIEEMNKKYPRWYNNWTETGMVYNYGNDLDENGVADDGEQTYLEYCGGIDYSEYYNHHCLAISNTSGYMSGGWTSSNYNINTAPSVIGKIAAESGPTWGPAHEIGHQHQAIFTLNGQTEVTNNLFSNIGVWYMGMATSRINGSEGSLTSVLDAFNSEGNDTYTNNIWALTHIYYKLWLYYHLVGNNTQFYPRFFEEMRKDPMVKVNAASGSQQTGSEGLLKMYKHFCTAAGEDLTEFFRAHGFFEVMDNRYVGDYSSSYYTQTQEEIDSVIAVVKAKGYEENLAPLFISDATAETTYQHDGVTARAYWDDATESGNNAEMGSYVDFVDETAAASTTELTLSGSTMSVSDESGVGVAILNSDGEIIGFSTMTEFEISDEVAEAIMTGEVQFVSVSSTGETVEATVDLNAMRAAALAEIIATAKSDYIAYANNYYVGWYKSSAVVELQEAITKGEEAFATGAVDSYIVFYELIAAEIEALRANEYAKVAFSPAHTYTFVNKLYPTYSMYMNGTDVKTSTGSTNNVWQLEASSTDGAYYIKNTGTETYVGSVAKSTQVTSTESGSNAYSFNPISNYYWAMHHTAAGDFQYLHCDGSKNIVGWSASEGSQWALKIVTIDELAVNTDALQTLVAQTDELLGSVAAVETTYTITAVENLASKLYCNAATTTQAEYSEALTDGNNNTVLHSKWQEGTTSEDSLNYYIRVDMGESASVDNFQFTYKTRNLSGSIHSPTNIQVQVSNDNATYETIRTLTADADSLPRTINTDYTSPVISCNGKSYRYVRLMVMKSSGANGDATDTGKTNSTDGFPIFVLSEFGFNTAVPQYTATVNSEYSSVDNILSLVVAAYEENIDAKNHLSWSDLTNEQITTEISELQADYDALAAAIATADKSELEALIEATTMLKGQLYETVITSYTANEVTLSITEGDAGYIYCNAPEKNSTWATDNAGVAALIDLTDGNPNLETFLHTEYGNDQSADGLDHYLRVDLGADGATDYVEFGYYGRSGHVVKSPKKVIVAATNDLTDGGVWTEIATLNLAQASANTETKTGCLGNGVEYRYWRFLVEETHGGGTDGNNHQFFCMTEFNVYKCTEIVKDEQLKYSPTIYIYTTTEFVTEVENAIAAATAVKDNAEALQPAVDAAVEALQAVYDKLAEALRYANAPVEITTDEANPILYNIISKRADDGSKVLQYCEFDAENPKTVSVSDKTANNSYQAWYFMESTNGIVIKPFNGDGKVLGADNTDNGDTKVWAVAEDEKSYDEWNFVARADGYYNIQVYDCSNYFSNNNGVGFKMGFWSGSPESDEGSLFKFVKATFENDNARYYQLSDFENTLEYQTADTPEGTTVGAFVNGSAYSEAYTAARTLITAGNTSDATACREAYTALRTASENLEEIVIEEGKYYRIDITPGLTGNRAGASMCIDNNGKLAWGEFVDADARFYFTFEYDGDDNLYMKNLHTATYLDEALANNENKQVGADAELTGDAKKVAVNRLGVCNEKVVLSITPDGGAMLNCKAEEPYYIVTYNNTAVDKASAWVITEVDEISGVMENVVHSVSLGADESGSGKAYSTLYLGYNATIPNGVTASVVTEINEIGQLVMEEVTGDILPAKTAVVLSGENAGGAEFKYADGEPSFSTSNNILKGTSYTKLENCGNSHNIYMLGKKNGRVAFYRAYENRNASGDKVTVNGTTNHNESGYVQCNANKAYLMVPEENAQAAAAMFSFFMGGNTTDLESINAVADTYDNVYDLQGRKHTEITEPGMYIVGGKKVLVK